MPEMQLKVVLLPEPLGPIRPRISPSLTSNDTLETAVKPSNFLVRPETVRITTEKGAFGGDEMEKGPQGPRWREVQCGQPGAAGRGSHCEAAAGSRPAG